MLPFLEFIEFILENYVIFQDCMVVSKNVEDKYLSVIFTTRFGIYILAESGTPLRISTATSSTWY